MALNLVQHRGEPSVWDRADDRMAWDRERWLAAVLAGAFLVSGLPPPLGGRACCSCSAAARSPGGRRRALDERAITARGQLRAALPARRTDGRSGRRSVGRVVPGERRAVVDADDRQHRPDAGHAEPPRALSTADGGHARLPEGAALVGRDPAAARSTRRSSRTTASAWPRSSPTTSSSRCSRRCSSCSRSPATSRSRR